eukprot:jgi/Chlat1/2583/Chrsp178S02443
MVQPGQLHSNQPTASGSFVIKRNRFHQLVEARKRARPSSMQADKQVAAASTSEAEAPAVHINELPAELLVNVFCFLQSEDIAACASMCRRWRHVATDPLIWRTLCRREYGCSARWPSVPWLEHYKQVRLCFSKVPIHKTENSCFMVSTIIRRMRLMQADCLNALSVLEHAEDVSGTIVSRKVGIAEDSALHIASDRGFGGAVDWLLDHRAYIHAANADGNYPIHYAARRGHTSTVLKLLDAGAEVDCTNHMGSTPLFGAVVVGDLQLMALLVDRGADIDCANHLGETPLFIATWIGPLRSLTWLLQQGANPNIADQSGIAPLHKASLLGDLSSVQLLVDFGADLDQVSVSGRSALHFASASGNCEVVSLLLARGANVNMQDRAGDTPLHVSAAKGRFEVAQLLVAAGANGSIRNNERLTPAAVAWLRPDMAMAVWLHSKYTSSMIAAWPPPSL